MSSPRHDVIDALWSTYHATLPYFDADADVLKRSYGPGKWNLRQILVHLADTEGVLLDRLRRLASETNPILQAFDQDVWASGLFYETRCINLARQQYDVTRRSVLELAKTLPLEIDARSGTHSEAGTRTFGQILNTVHKHNAHHLGQCLAIRENRQWTPVKANY